MAACSARHRDPSRSKMETKMSKRTEMNLGAVVFIIIGLFYLFKEILASLILIAVGLTVSPDIRTLVLKGLSFLWSKIVRKDRSQEMKESPSGIQQQSGRNSIVKQIINAEKVIIQQPERSSIASYVEGSSTNKKETALRDIYKKMIKPLKLLNLAANLGLKNEEEYKKINESIEDFIDTKIEYELDLDNEMKDKFDQVMAAFRHTRHELFLKVREGKFNEGLYGLKSFDFIEKCKNATEEIKNRLRK